jgi:hypothetical protein
MIPNCAGPIRQGVTGVEIITLVPHKVISLDWFAEDWVIWWVDCCGQKKSWSWWTSLNVVIDNITKGGHREKS